MIWQEHLTNVATRFSEPQIYIHMRNVQRNIHNQLVALEQLYLDLENTYIYF